MKVLRFLFLFFFTITTVAFAQEWRNVTRPDDVFESGYIQVVGVSADGQNRYAALRAAEVIAQRELLETLLGLTLYGETTIKEGMMHSDLIKTNVKGVLRGAVTCGKKYYPAEGYAEVCKRIYLKGRYGLYSIFLPLIKDERIPVDKLPDYKPSLAVKKKTEVVYDGLIVDVGSYPFRPAIVNRIITENNEIIFDPSKVANDILIERGCGGFTKDIAKAKALLSKWGTKRPLIVKAVGVYKGTDVKVSKEDALRIYRSNEETNFLAEAKVVFVVR